MKFMLDVLVRSLIIVHFLTYYDNYIKGFLMFIIVVISLFWCWFPLMHEYEIYKLKKDIEAIQNELKKPKVLY